MSAVDTSRVLEILSERITNRDPEWQRSPWPGALYHQGEGGQVSPYSGYRYALVPRSTEPASPVDGANHRDRRDQRNAVSDLELRWSVTVPLDDGAGPFHSALVQERKLLEVASKPDGEPIRVLWQRSTRDVMDAGWVVGTIALRVHHEIEMR